MCAFAVCDRLKGAVGWCNFQGYAGAGSWWFRSAIAAPWRPGSELPFCDGGGVGVDMDLDGQPQRVVEARAERDLVEAGNVGRAADEPRYGFDGPEGAHANSYHRPGVLGDSFADLVDDGGDDSSGPAGPGGGDGLAGQHLSCGIEDGGAGLGSAEVDDDVDASGLGSARAPLRLIS